MMQDVLAELDANVWKVTVTEGDRIDEGDQLMILESMKMEIPVESPAAGIVKQIRVKETDMVTEGDILAVIS